MNLLEHIGNQIRELRQAYGKEGLSQGALAEMLGIAPNTVSRWETANYKPSIEDLQKLADTFSVSLLEFFPSDSESLEKKGALKALMRSVENLPSEDIEELQRYAEFRKARSMYSGGKKPTKGRKSKG